MDALRYLKKKFPSYCNRSLITNFFQFDLGCPHTPLKAVEAMTKASRRGLRMCITIS
jgi:hypothetical protein